MKSKFILLLILTAVASALAETDSAREFRQLQDQRQKALIAAAEPVNRRYQAALEQLFRRATMADDLDTAIAIRSELATVAPASATTTTTPPATAPTETTDTSKTPLGQFLSGTRWVWFDSADLTGKPSWIELYKDGKGRSSWGEPLVYQVTDPDKLTLTQATAGMNTWYFIVDRAKKVALPDPEKSKGHEIRSLRYEKKISSTGPR